MEAHQDSQRCLGPQEAGLHKQIKDAADLLRPELQRLYNSPNESSGNIQLYISFIQEIKSVKRDVRNQDLIFAYQGIINHMQKAIELCQKNGLNQEILWHLQEVMALSFKVQNLPS
jgi:hypothetical protein